MERGSGILMHITSLPNDLGIGTLGYESYKFIDFLERIGQKYWQILPLGQTGYGNSPYQCFSSFAGNPFLISLELLEDRHLLKKSDYMHLDYGKNKRLIDFRKIQKNKMQVLRLAYKHGKTVYKKEIENFQKENKWWIKDYALYMAVKNRYRGKSWMVWNEKIKHRDEKCMEKYHNLLHEEVCFWIFIQYIFFEQWKHIKRYANNRGIKIIGDIPIYTALDSADVWANSELFKMDQEKKPTKISGCPPDSFSCTGQLWGNPVYDWKMHEKTDYKWWLQRIKAGIQLYDYLRIDHFRGFESYWEIPFGAKNAINGKWVKGPGIDFFNQIKKNLGEVNIIAEDLGFLTSKVREFLKHTQYPGMKVLQFAFNPREKSEYLLHNHVKNSVVYTGTHDNDTIKGWFKNSPRPHTKFAIKYLQLSHKEQYHWGFIRGAWSSVANVSITQMQDILGLGSFARMNKPSTFGQKNWKWRMLEDEITEEQSLKIYELTKIYGRL